MQFEVVPAYAVSLDEQARVANEAFAGYVGGWSELDAASLARFLMLQGADLFHSRFVRTAEGLAGFGYITRTANIVRLSGMGVIPSARGTGAAAYLLLHLFDEANASGDAAMTLEVIEQNPRAHSLYLRHGFEQVARLSGWRLRPDAERPRETDAMLTAVSVLDVLGVPTHRNYPDVPWQISRHAIAKVPNLRAYRYGDAHVVISDPAATPIRIYALLSRTGDSAELRGALHAVMRMFPDREFFAPPLWPEDLSTEVFAPLGFAPEQISQFFMRRDFGASPQ